MLQQRPSTAKIKNKLKKKKEKNRALKKRMSSPSAQGLFTRNTKLQVDCPWSSYVLPYALVLKSNWYFVLFVYILGRPLRVFY